MIETTISRTQLLEDITKIRVFYKELLDDELKFIEDKLSKVKRTTGMLWWKRPLTKEEIMSCDWMFSLQKYDTWRKYNRIKEKLSDLDCIEKKILNTPGKSYTLDSTGIGIIYNSCNI